MNITVARIGNGTDENPYKPDTTAKTWQLIEEKETEFVIEITEE